MEAEAGDRLFSLIYAYYEVSFFVLSVGLDQRLLA
ncbi:Unannotated [Lentimonas sp. CC4]|nr:Unannotated [Lentimonas sp. CC4]CAA6683625.1 Unannotated [Lentimonas sp. CC6]CAA7074529.1 Unannotated [Lentimonas sp. CC4]CAA7169144.1 Unannotated [Lentimonas sp. CC21]CAA7180454.1 Unannotated [Lentimonas sp. CC8]